MQNLEALAFGMNDLSHVLLPLALLDLGYGCLGLGHIKIFPLLTLVLLTLYWPLVDLGHVGLGHGPVILRMKPWPGRSLTGSDLIGHGLGYQTWKHWLLV